MGYRPTVPNVRAVMQRTPVLLVVAFALVLVSCGEVEAENCEQIADFTVDLMQELVDEVEKEVGEMSVEELNATGGDLPSVEQFRKDAEKIDVRAIELGCTQIQIQDSVGARIDQLEAETPIGRFIIDAIRAGGL